MKLTPIEIKQHNFKTKMRGYCQEEVHAFLAEVSEEFSKQKTEIKQLNQQIKKLENEVSTAGRGSDKLEKLAESINTIKEDLLKNAEKEASLKLEEAKIKATRMIQAAERKISTLEADIRVLESRRKAVKENVSSFLQSQLNSLVSLNSSFESGTTAPPAKREEEEAKPNTANETVIEAELIMPHEGTEEMVLGEIEVEPLTATK